MNEKILLVDDEPAVLQGYRRILHNQFELDTAVGGAGALITLAENGPYAVVVSDMRMPEMNGVELLSQIKTLYPDVIRVMLTGNADLNTAINAVNEGSIFRFLTKPCTKDTLARTLTAALVQYRLVTAEKHLLEQTLSGSIHVLTEVLSLVNPAAFGRSVRIRGYMAHAAKALGLTEIWRFEVAAMMSQLGCVTLDPETINAVYSGSKLSPEEQSRYDTHPAIAHDLLVHIPRMEPIAWMIAHQRKPAAVETDLANREMADMRLGAEILRVVLIFDELLHRGLSRTEAAHKVAHQNRALDPRIFEALVEFQPDVDAHQVRACPIQELSIGMILEQEIRTSTGLLLVAKGQEITFPLILKLKNFREKGAVPEEINVLPPRCMAPQGNFKHLSAEAG